MSEISLENHTSIGQIKLRLTGTRLEDSREKQKELICTTSSGMGNYLPIEVSHCLLMKR